MDGAPCGEGSRPLPLGLPLPENRRSIGGGGLPTWGQPLRGRVTYLMDGRWTDKPTTGAPTGMLTLCPHSGALAQLERRAPAALLLLEV